MECAFDNIAQGHVILTSLSSALLHSRTINTRSLLCVEKHPGSGVHVPLQCLTPHLFLFSQAKGRFKLGRWCVAQTRKKGQVRSRARGQVPTRIREPREKMPNSCTQEGEEVVGQGRAPLRPSGPGPYLPRCLVLLLSATLPPSPPLGSPLPGEPPIPAPAPAREPQDQDAAGWLTSKPRRLTAGLALTTDRLVPPQFSLQEPPSSLSLLRPPPSFYPRSSASVAKPVRGLGACSAGCESPRRKVSGKQTEGFCRNPSRGEAAAGLPARDCDAGVLCHR